jgi:hypothetical protein
VLRDLTAASPGDLARERSRVATTGWGARLLACQDANGRWDGGLYSPKWTSTTYTLLLLHWLGLPSGHPQALRGCQVLWDGAAHYVGGLDVPKSRPEDCITGMFVLVAAAHGYDDARVALAVDWLLARQLDDGGWNCAARPGDRAKHASFHTSITALDALQAWGEARPGDRDRYAAAMARGRQFFLDHHLYRSHRTGEVAIKGSTRFPLVPQWHFDVMRGLEHFVAADVPDQRLADAVDVVRRSRRPDGAWPTYRGYPGRTWFELEPHGPSRWNTVRALRVLRWWEAGTRCLTRSER